MTALDTARTGGDTAALLDTLVADCLAWADARREWFRLPPGVTTTATDPTLTLKPLGELAELSHVIAHRHPDAAVRARAGDLFAFAWRETGEGALFAELMRGEPQATYPVELYGIFARAGLRHPEADQLAALYVSLRGWRVAREDHTRTLGILNAESRIGLSPHADPALVARLTGLGLRPEPWSLDLRALYGITHDVFHLTDWGRDPAALPPVLAAYLRLWVPAWLETWLEEELWDLVGELIAVLACLPEPVPVPDAWRRLVAGARADDGSLPERGAPPAPGTAPQEAFRACYHSTLVTAFAATLARTPGGHDGAHEGPTAAGDPPAAPPSRAGDPPSEGPRP